MSIVAGPYVVGANQNQPFKQVALTAPAWGHVHFLLVWWWRYFLEGVTNRQQGANLDLLWAAHCSPNICISNPTYMQICPAREAVYELADRNIHMNTEHWKININPHIAHSDSIFLIRVGATNTCLFIVFKVCVKQTLSSMQCRDDGQPCEVSQSSLRIRANYEMVGLDEFKKISYK